MPVNTTSLQVTDAFGATKNLATNTDPGGVQAYAVTTDRPGSALYRAAASFTPQPTAAVTLITIQGSASRRVRIKRIVVGGVSTANGSVLYQIIRSTALGAGGTAVSPLIAKLDSGTDAAATAVVTHYTTTAKAAGTSTGIGPIQVGRLYTSVVGAPTVHPAASVLYPDAGGVLNQAIVLRGTGDFLEIQNINGANLAAGTVLDYSIEFEETLD